ncbi:MAG: OmpA family protein, partial [Saprospiraceae bacterium]
MKYYLLFFMFVPLGLDAQSTPGPQTEYKTISIFFRGGSYYVDDTEKEKVRDFLSKEILSNFEIHIHSHTDNIGGVKFNEWLSKMRSQSALEFLTEDGVPTNKLFIKDHGLEDPNFDNSTWDGRLKNR